MAVWTETKDGRYQVLDQMTAPGDSVSLQVEWNRDHTIQYKIAAIDTNVIVRVEGSFDDTDYFHLDDDASDTTKTANGTYMFHKGNFRIRYIRFKFVSESGGTAATIDVKYMGR